MMRALASVLLVVGMTSAASAAQPLGRLFFSPAERAALDIARTQKRVPEKTVTAEPAPDAPPPPQIITFNGLVRRSDGKSTLWLNNRPFDEKETLSGLAVTGRIRSDGGVTLQVPETGASINLRVGQRAELQTGRIAEGKPPKQEPPQKTDAPAKSDGKAESAAKPDASAKPGTAPAKQAEGEPAEKKAESAPLANARDNAPPRAAQPR